MNDFILNLKFTVILKFSLAFICLLSISTNILAQSHEIGQTTIYFYDVDRNRNIETKIYYPADNPGDNVPIASGNFPVLVFGHGFLIGWDAYHSYWTELIPEGYIICFPTTEMSLSPSHQEFGFDLRFIGNAMQDENDNANSLFYNSIAPKTGLMGHSMGGGASFLAAENNTNINTLINFAAAETNPSAIAASANISIPSLIFSGDDDCVAPANENQDLMYDNLSSNCKTQIDIINGAHCYFADYNFNCNLGESFCNPSIEISREEQQLITFDFLKLWLEYSLYDNQNAFDIFNDSLQSSNRISYSQDCNITSLDDLSKNTEAILFPNPVIDILNFSLAKEYTGGLLTIYNFMGKQLHKETVNKSDFQLNISHLPKGTYLFYYSKNNFVFSDKLIKQ